MKTLALIVLLVALTLPSCHCQLPASGEKVGHIVKIEQSGVVCPTYEAELIRGGQTGGSGVAGGNTFHFTIPDESVEGARTAMEANREVKVFYKRPFFISMCKTHVGVVSTQVAPLNNEAK